MPLRFVEKSDKNPHHSVKKWNSNIEERHLVNVNKLANVDETLAGARFVVQSVLSFASVIVAIQIKINWTRFHDVDRVWSGDRCERWSASGWRSFCACRGQVGRYRGDTCSARRACANWPPGARLPWASCQTSKMSTTPYLSTLTGSYGLQYSVLLIYPHLTSRDCEVGLLYDISEHVKTNF